MKQFLDMALQRADSLNSRRESYAQQRSSGDVEEQKQALLDEEEVKIQGEIDFNERIISERQEDLNNAEQLIMETRDIAKQINSKVHEQREDLVEINDNATKANENAKEAEENIIEAQ